MILLKWGVVKILKTWHLKTTDGRAIYQDFRSNATFDNDSNVPLEFIEEHPALGKQALANVVASEFAQNAGDALTGHRPEYDTECGLSVFGKI